MCSKALGLLKKTCGKFLEWFHKIVLFASPNGIGPDSLDTVDWRYQELNKLKLQSSSNYSTDDFAKIGKRFICNLKTIIF